MVSAHDRELMRRLAAYQASTHAEARERHLALSVPERLQRSWELYLTYREAANVSARDDDPSSFYDLARKLGLYIP